MSNEENSLAHRIKIKFGTAPGEPTPEQLERIRRDIALLVASGKTPSHGDWSAIIQRHCPTSGKYGYGGADMSDLTTLLVLATNSQKK